MARCTRVIKRGCMQKRKRTLFGRVPSRNVRQATPARSRNSRRGIFRTAPLSVRRGGSHLSPIKESPTAEHCVIIANERLPDLTPQPHQEEPSSLARDFANNESASDDIMPSGVSSFLIDCMDSSSQTDSCEATSSNYPSPEVFRTADAYEETMDFSFEEDLQVKNSTLLDVSHAVDINMRQPPNLSAILGTSRKPVEKDPEKIMGNVSNSFTVCKTPESEKTTLRSSERKCQTRKDFIPLSQPTKKCRPVKCQKQFLLQSVVTATQVEGVKASCETEVTTQPVCEPLSTLGELNSEVQSKKDLKDNLWKVQLEKNESENIPAADPKSIKRHEPLNKARLFIFADEAERNSVLQRKEGKHPSLFPSQPLNLNNTPSEEIIPVFVKFKSSEMHDPEKLHEVCWMQLLHVGEAFFSNSRFKRIVTDEGAFYEDYGKFKQY